MKRKGYDLELKLRAIYQRSQLYHLLRSIDIEARHERRVWMLQQLCDVDSRRVVEAMRRIAIQDERNAARIR